MSPHLNKWTEQIAFLERLERCQLRTRFPRTAPRGPKRVGLNEQTTERAKHKMFPRNGGKMAKATQTLGQAFIGNVAKGDDCPRWKSRSTEIAENRNFADGTGFPPERNIHVDICNVVQSGRQARVSLVPRRESARQKRHDFRGPPQEGGSGGGFEKTAKWSFWLVPVQNFELIGTEAHGFRLAIVKAMSRIDISGARPAV